MHGMTYMSFTNMSKWVLKKALGPQECSHLLLNNVLND